MATWDSITLKPSAHICREGNGKLCCEARLDLLDFFRHLDMEKLISSNLWIQGVELGNQVMGDCDG